MTQRTQTENRQMKMTTLMKMSIVSETSIKVMMTEWIMATVESRMAAMTQTLGMASAEIEEEPARVIVT